MTSHKGLFKPKNPTKYKGNPSNIVYRSSWELKYMMKLDHDPNVIQWGSEENFIAYRSPLDNQVHRYFPDFWIKTKEGEFIVEIKPHFETQPPIRVLGKDRTFYRQAATYARNIAKWKAAKIHCEQRGWKFMILTETELGMVRPKKLARM